MEKTKNSPKESAGVVDALFAAGAHFGFVKARRHPSAKPFILGAKNKVEIFDLNKTSQELAKALAFVEEQGKAKAMGLFVGGKSEARKAVEQAGRELEMPFVAGRWIGGTLTNFGEIKKRIARLEELTTQREKGELAKYTKKERLLIDREIDKLNLYFSGLSTLKNLPKFMVVIDPKKENIAVAEAKRMKVPVVALAGSDTNLYEVDYAIPGNDASRQSVSFILGEIVKSYKQGVAEAAKDSEEKSVQS
ncbi:30S ribosomal protein S2 [Candidatus Parcubacteria bacterium]|nr:30S ribosomal protein S2 [Candidatus Parcubacteria bacterium]